MLCGDLAYQVQGVAIAWHIFTLNHQPLDLGFIGLALFLPSLILVVPAGECSDRFPRRNIVVVTQTLEALCAAVLLFAILHNVRDVAVYLGILVGIGTVRAFGSPAERSLLPSILKREEFVSLQARFSALRQLINIGGPALGGILVAWGTPFAFWVSIVMTLLSVAFFACLRTGVTQNVERAFTWHGAFDGFRFIRAHPVVAGAISLDLFAVLLGGATALLPAYADGIFHIGPTGLGVLRSAPALGAASIAIFLSRCPPNKRVGRTLFIAVAIFGIATIAFGLSRNFPLSVMMLVVAGGADMFSVVIRNGLVQLTTPNEMRGRVTAFEGVFIGASNELGAFESGLMAAAIGVVPSVVVGGIGTLAVIGLWTALFPALRRADALSGHEKGQTDFPEISGSEA
jgi:MFS family permease